MPLRGPLVGCLFALVAAGCRPEPVRVPGPAFVLPPGGWAEFMAQRSASLRSFEAVASLDLDSPERSGTFDAVLVYAAPDRFRLRAFKRLGPTLFDCLVANGEVRQYWPDRRTVTVRPADAAGAPGGARLFAWLSPPSPSVAFVETRRDPEGIVVEMRDSTSGPCRRSLTVDPLDGNIRSEVILDAGRNPLVTLAYAGYRDAGGVSFPHLVRIEATDPGGGVRIECRLRRVTVNAPLSPDAFDPTLPEGTVEERP
ncbi:MAG: hypothetical protein HYY93_03680 [Planctomycetes bacterium]|nr:hypothetical protein [Planctomycetota bacterium]